MASRTELVSLAHKELLRRAKPWIRTRAASELDPVRRFVHETGKQLSLGLDTFWNAARSAEEGHIDVIDMFSGCGGMSAGFLAANSILPAYRLALAVDVDQVANRTYATNLGISPVNSDVAAVTAKRVAVDSLLANSRRRKGHPLVLIGCAPCQGFSSHRNSRGRGDPRNSLFASFFRAASFLRPDIIVAENVPELLTARYWHLVARARTMLENSGYCVHLTIHNMAAFGLPQERFRAVLLAMKRPFRALHGFLDRSEFRTVRDAIGELPPISAGERHATDSMHYTARHSESTLHTIKQVPRDGGNRPPNVGPKCLIRARERQGRGAYDDVYGRLAWDKPSITITAYARNPASGRFVHPRQHRGLSIREAAILQGFPGDYWFAGSLDDSFRQIGNAVPPRFSSYLAIHMLGEFLAPEPPNRMEPGILEPVGSSFSRIIAAIKRAQIDRSPDSVQ